MEHIYPAPVRRPDALRRALALSAMLLLASCGGGDATPPTVAPPPPPPPPAVAASIAVSAGDGQVGEPNSLAATAPAVVVRSASGAGVPGVSVVFVVDSGGGSLGTSTATTDANGVASAGSWRLGSTEGPQVLIASVSSLPPVRIRATVRIEPKAVGGGTVSSQGGVITVNQPGSPLNGLRIDMPAGAVASNATVSMSIASSAGLSLRPGVRATSPVLTLTSSAGRLRQPATIRFPVPGGTAQSTFIAVRNPTTGDMTILPPLGRDSVSVSAVLFTMDASQIAGAPGAAPRFMMSSSRQNDPVGLFTILIDDPTILTKPYDSQFRARRDNWDFEAVPIAWLPFLPGTAQGKPEEEVLDPSAGMIATSLWYFENRRADGPLYNRFRLQPDQAYSNKMGFRWAALANRELPDPGAQLSKSWDEWISLDPGVFAKTQLDGLKVLFYLERERPLPVLLFDAFEEKRISVGVGIATRVDGDEVRIVVANNSESEYVAKVLPTGLRPFAVLDRNGSEAFTVRAFAPLLNRTMTDGPGVGSNWGRVVAGTLGDAEGWPSPTLHFEKGELDTASVFLGDTLTFWWQCAGCPDYGLRAPNLPTASHLQAFLFGRKISGAIAPFPTDVIRGAVRWRSDSVSSDVTPTVTGHAVFLPQIPPGVPGKVIPGWLDWKVVNFKRTSLRPNPSTLEIGKDTTATFTLSPTTALPSGTRYSWVLRTADGRDSMETTTMSHPRNLKVDKPGKLLITALEAGTKRVIARDSVEIKAGEPVPFWKLTTFVDVDDLVDPPGSDEGQGGPFFELLWGAESLPGSALITTTGNQLSMRVKRVGVWSGCCPPTLGGDDRVWIWPTWSQSTTDLASGTLTGVRTEGQSEFRVQATRNGKIMTGTMTLRVSVVDSETGKTEVSTYRFTFTAERMR